jgi:ParB/RepB/Spo0J family partition protein
MDTKISEAALAASTPLTILLDNVVPSPTNPRKAFDTAALEDLAASIRKHGVLQPVLVRPWPASRKPPKDFPHAAEAGFELVVGERRWRAARLAGLDAIPATVREMADAEVVEVQIVENLQRSDLHPLEEADGYRQLMAKGHDVAKIAEQTGRSVKYVYDRVKLLSLTKAAQKAFLAGDFTAGHAVILARLKPADQERAMLNDGALFTDERLLFTPDEEDGLGDRDPRKARSVRELQGWVDEHVRLEAAQADPMLFPDTALALKAATDEKEKVVRITHEVMTPEDAKDGPRPILGRSWKRADGQRGSKQCDRSVIGMIVIGPGRGEALRVCLDKKHCAVHWGDLIKAAKKREKEVAKAGATGEDREAIRRRKHDEEQARAKAEAERWDKARPAILAALAAAVKKAPAGANGFLGKLVLEAFQDAIYFGPEDGKYRELVPAGKSAEDLVRHVAFTDLVNASGSAWQDEKRFATEAKALGVDVRKIVAASAPEARCEKCGRTEARACKGGCSWTREPDPKSGLGLCSRCASKAAIAAGVKTKKKAAKGKASSR